MKTFQTCLETDMLSQSINQKELASLLDLSQQAVSKWLNGKDAPRPDTKRKIAEIFGPDSLVAKYLRESEQVENLYKQEATEQQNRRNKNAQMDRKTVQALADAANAIARSADALADAARAISRAADSISERD